MTSFWPPFARCRRSYMRKVEGSIGTPSPRRSTISSAQAGTTGQRLIALEAREVAKRNVGTNNSAVATSLGNLAALYCTIRRATEAEALEKRAARVRSIKR